MSEAANFRVLRETMGFTREDVADALGVSVRSVKRWENPREENLPPEDAWVLLEDAQKKRREIVSQALEVVDYAKARGGVVEMTYYRSQEQFDKVGDGGCYRVANANARAVAKGLEDEGIVVEWSYPDDRDSSVPLD